MDGVHKQSCTLILFVAQIRVICLKESQRILNPPKDSHFSLDTGPWVRHSLSPLGYPLSSPWNLPGFPSWQVLLPKVCYPRMVLCGSWCSLRRNIVCDYSSTSALPLISNVQKISLSSDYSWPLFEVENVHTWLCTKKFVGPNPPHSLTLLVCVCVCEVGGVEGVEH